jgi:hypothetical protein
VYCVQALACAFERGKDWITHCYRQLELSLPGLDVDLDDTLRTNIEDAVDWAVGIEMDEDIDADLSEAWDEESAVRCFYDQVPEDEAAAGEADLRDADGPTTDLEDDTLMTPQQHCYQLMLQLVDAIVTTGLAISDRTDRSDPDVPYAVQMYGHSVVFLPVFQKGEHCDICIPRAIVGDSYQWMSRAWAVWRAWAVRSSRSLSDKPRYRLIAKTRIVGNIQISQIESSTVVIC